MAKTAEKKPAKAAASETKFGVFLAAKKLDGRRLLIASDDLEKLRPEDRAIRLARRTAKGDDKKAAPTEGEKKKPRSGRPITPRTIHAALVGKPLSGPIKTRLLRAVNKLLEHKKQEPIKLDVLF